MKTQKILCLSVIISIIIHAVMVFFLPAFPGAEVVSPSLERAPVQFFFCKGKLVSDPVPARSPRRAREIQPGPFRDDTSPGIVRMQESPAVPVAPEGYIDEPFLSIIGSAAEKGPEPEREAISPVEELLRRHKTN